MEEMKSKSIDEVRNDELKMAMVTFKLEQSHEKESEFVRELQKAYFIIPALKEGKNDELTIMLLSDQNKVNFFQAYTDMDEYKKWIKDEESQEFILTFPELAHIVINACENDDRVGGLVINPFSENFILNKNSLTNIFRMDKVFIDEEKRCSSKVSGPIKDILKKENKVNKAYLMHMTKNNIPGYLLIIDAKVKDKKKLFDKIGKEIINSFKTMNIDIVSYEEKLGQDVTKGKKPFYEKDK